MRILLARRLSYFTMSAVLCVSCATTQEKPTTVVNHEASEPPATTPSTNKTAVTQQTAEPEASPSPSPSPKITTQTPSSIRPKTTHTKAAIVSDKTETITPLAPPIETSKQKTSDTEALVFSRADLPLTIGSWTLSESDLRGEDCQLKSVTVNTFDGQGDTGIYVVITQNKTFIHTNSNIDLSYRNTGIIFGDTIVPPENLSQLNSAVITKGHNDLQKHFAAHDHYHIKLGFWPTWPVTQAYGGKFANNRFKAAQHALSTCAQML